MTSLKSVMVVVGTRADSIKMLPIARALREQGGLDVRLVSTGQHREILDGVFHSFDIQPDIRFDVMQHGQSLSDLSAQILQKMDSALKRRAPDLVLVHGDTLTGFAAGMSAHYRKIKVAHVEAGLRSHNLWSPFPEEFHRKALSVLADFHFAPNEEARVNLLNSGVANERIFVVGQSGADAVGQMLKDSPLESGDEGGESRVLMTLHRRETGPQNMVEILKAIAEAAVEMPHVRFDYPVHPNPVLRSLVQEHMGGVGNIRVLPALPYERFLRVLSRADLVLTDSGGIQEEGVLLGRQVFLVRDLTERSDGLDSQQVEVLGRDPQVIRDRLWEFFNGPVRSTPPQSLSLGASTRISNIVMEMLHA